LTDRAVVFVVLLRILTVSERQPGTTGDDGFASDPPSFV
jgi:hypothetical protein